MNLDLDLLRQRVELSFRTRDGNDFQLFRLTCEAVTGFEYTNEIPGPWAYVETTEAEAVDLADGQIQIRLEFYNDPSGLIVTAGRAALDREQVP